MNYVSLLGRLVKDPELRYTQSGKAYCRFTLAVNRPFNRDEADFINCVAWNKEAELIAEYLRKGRRALIQGRLNVGNYEKNGERVWTTDVVVSSFEFVDSMNARNQDTNNYNSNSKKSETGSEVFDNQFVVDNDDIIDDDDFPF